MEYVTLFLYLLDVRPGDTKREQRARGTRWEGRKTISFSGNSIVLALLPFTHPQKLTDKYQTLVIQLAHAGNGGPNSETQLINTE